MTEQSISPVFDRGGNIVIATAAGGTTFTPYAARTLSQLTIVNDTGTAIEWQQDGAGVALPVADGMTFTIFGITDAGQIGVRRVDQAITSVNVKARWEA